MAWPCLKTLIFGIMLWRWEERENTWIDYLLLYKNPEQDEMPALQPLVWKLGLDKLLELLLDLEL